MAEGSAPATVEVPVEVLRGVVEGLSSTHYPDNEFADGCPECEALAALRDALGGRAGEVFEPRHG